ncbi:MAG: hypothetical protein J5804_05005, partial [Eggerthellaceae bacterium]|nr:hypothetical protein [Eggerthellaceae bacterium]
MGADGSSSQLNDGVNVRMYDIHVNPVGLLDNWAGGSVVSVLEAPWIYAKFRDSSYDFTTPIREFYSTFYGYDLNQDDLDTILAGRES